jgi:hypothetical protein
MKVLCSQEVVSPHVCGAVPCQVTAKASAPQVPWFVLCLWLQKGLQENMAWFEHIDFYAFSRGSFRKPARNLIEIAQRKSQVITRAKRAGKPVVAGGPHPTSYWEDIEDVDYFLLGEVEATFPLFLRDLFMQRLTLLLFSSSADCQLTRAPSGAGTGNNRDCSVMSPVKRPCSQTGDCAWPGGAAPARSAQ